MRRTRTVPIFAGTAAKPWSTKMGLSPLSGFKVMATQRGQRRLPGKTSRFFYVSWRQSPPSQSPPRLYSSPEEAVRADQFSSLRSTGILPVAEKHGQDAHATPSAGTQFEQLTGPKRQSGHLRSPNQRVEYRGLGLGRRSDRFPGPLERWLSGRKRRFAKPVGGKLPRRFESCPLRFLLSGKDLGVQRRPSKGFAIPCRALLSGSACLT